MWTALHDIYLIIFKWSPTNMFPILQGSIDFDGLGPVHWWQDVDEEAS